MPEPSPCVDDEALFALARGKLESSELSRVEAHLQGCGDCRAVLAEAARSLEPAPETPSAAEPRSPARVARYEIVALLGAGAAGVVYRAFDPQLRREVAVKLLRPELHGEFPEQSARMLREAQAMARLSDPHVVAVYDVRLHEGTVYLVMEYVDGHTLSAWLKEQPRSLDEILAVFASAGRGLAAAHQKGLVHRDFKPENVLVARDGRAFVTDFGLARESDSWLRDRQADDQASTELYAPTRGLVGTPAYMAPELFEGGLASPASDQFAFCVALFVALFDKHPFKAGEGIALGELVTRVRGGTLQRPVLGDPTRERLFAVLERGLSAAPGSRFDDLPQLLGVLAGAGKRRSRRAWLVVSALVAFTLLGAAVWFSGVFAASFGAPAPSLTSAAPLPSAPPEPSQGAAVVGAPPEPSPPSPLASSASPAASAPAATPNQKRRPPKPGEVRYKDWLKDPF